MFRSVYYIAGTCALWFSLFFPELCCNIQRLSAMFILSCARALEPWDKRTQETLERTQLILPEMFLHIFHTHRFKCRWVLVKCCTKEILCAHRLWKIRGNIGYQTCCTKEKINAINYRNILQHVKKLVKISAQLSWNAMITSLEQASGEYAISAMHSMLPSINPSHHRSLICWCREFMVAVEAKTMLLIGRTKHNLSGQRTQFRMGKSFFTVCLKRQCCRKHRHSLNA